MKANIKLEPVTALYIRTSTSKQDTGADAQLNKLLNFMSDSGITDYVIYEDRGVSGAKAKRPEFNKMIADIKANKVKSVVTYSISRLGRQAHILNDFRRLLDAKGVSLVMLEENISTDTLNGKFIFQIHGCVAELGRDQIARATIAGLEEARRKGKTWGKPKTRPSKKIRKLHDEGLSLRAIAKECGCSLGSVQAEIKQKKAGRDIINWG